MTEQRGVRMGNEMLEFIRNSDGFRPRSDWLVIEPLPPDNTGMILLQDWKTTRGKVVATGPGRHPIGYDGPKGKRKKSWERKVFIPCTVKVGDVVNLGGRELGGYLFPTVRLGSKEVVLCREADVTGIETA